MKDILDINLSRNKYFLIYLISLLFFAVCCFNYENYIHPLKEIVILVFLAIIGFIVINYADKDKDLYKIAFIVIVLFGLLFVFLSPFNAATDEPEHLVRAEITSQNIVFPKYDEENGGFLTIESVTTVPRNLNVFETDWDTQKINLTPTYYDSAFLQNPFYGYIAPAIGLTLAKLLDLNQVWLLWRGRFFNLLLYGSICAIAIKKSPVMKMPMFVVACLPLAVELGASLNMDALTLSLSLLCIAYFFKMYKSKDKSVTKKNILTFFILVLIVALTKVTLGALALLILAVPISNFKHRKYIYLSIIGIFALLGILLAWNNFYGINSLYHSWRGTRFVERGVNPQGQLDYLLHNPQGIQTLLGVGLQIPSVISELNRIYTFFPSFNILSWIYAVFFLIFSLFYPIKEKFTNKSKIISFIVCFGIFVGTYFIQFLTWAPLGTTNLGDCGISTRYFVPFFSLIPLMLNINININKKNINIENLDKSVITCVIIFLGGLVVYVASLAY